MYHNLFICSTIDGQLGFHSGAVMNSVAVSILACAFWSMDIYVPVSYIPIWELLGRMVCVRPL